MLDLKVPPQHFKQVEVWTLSSFLFKTFCCGFAAVLGIIVLLREQTSAGQTDGLTFDSEILWYAEEFKAARCPGPEAAETIPKHHVSTTVLDSS